MGAIETQVLSYNRAFEEFQRRQERDEQGPDNDRTRA